MGLHETVHRSAFKTRLLNDAVMHFWGFLCMRPALHYFYYHWGHHKYTGDVTKDSELQVSVTPFIEFQKILSVLSFSSCHTFVFRYI